MRLNIVVGSSDVAYKYSGFRPKRKDEDFFEKDVNSGSGGAGVSKDGNNKSGNFKDSGKPGSGGGGGRRGGRSGYNNDRRGNYNNKKNEDKKPEENNADAETGSTPVVSKPVKITGYIPGAELEEDVKPSIKNNTTPIPSNPDNSKDSIKEPSPEIPKQQEAVDIEIRQDLETETINPIEQDEIPSLPVPTAEPQKNSKQIQQQHQPQKTQEIVQNNIKEVPKDVEQHHENGSTQVKSYTFNLSTPLGPEINSGEQTFIEINGSLYLKLTPPSPSNDAAAVDDTDETAAGAPSKPEWYTSLEEDFQKAKNPPPKKPAGKNNPKKNQQHHHHPEVQPELKNGKLVYPVKVPDYILQDLNIKPDFKKQQQQQQNNPQKKKNNY